MIRLRTLLSESLSELRFADIFLYAFKSIMDLDNGDMEVKDVDFRRNPTSFMYWGYNLKLVISYMSKKYYIPITFLYYKFPPEELAELRGDDWDMMLQQSEKFPNQDIDEKSFLKPNRLFRFTGWVISGDNVFNGDRLGVFEGCSVLEEVTQIKSIIDKSDSGDNEPDKETPPMPVSSKDLVSTYQ